jgi:hypothetical protein
MFSTKIVFEFLIPPIRVTCPAHHILFSFITLTSLCYLLTALRVRINKGIHDKLTLVSVSIVDYKFSTISYARLSGWHNIKAVDSYSGGTPFESQLSRLRCFVVISESIHTNPGTVR